MEIGGPLFRSSRAPEIWGYATGVDFVFVFQEDKFYPLTRHQKIRISSQNDSICIRPRHIGSWNNVGNPSDKWNNVWLNLLFNCVLQVVLNTRK